MNPPQQLALEPTHADPGYQRGCLFPTYPLLRSPNNILLQIPEHLSVNEIPLPFVNFASHFNISRPHTRVLGYAAWENGKSHAQPLVSFDFAIHLLTISQAHAIWWGGRKRVLEPFIPGSQTSERQHHSAAVDIAWGSRLLRVGRESPPASASISCEGSTQFCKLLTLKYNLPPQSPANLMKLVPIRPLLPSRCRTKGRPGILFCILPSLPRHNPPYYNNPHSAAIQFSLYIVFVMKNNSLSQYFPQTRPLSSERMRQMPGSAKSGHASSPVLVIHPTAGSEFTPSIHVLPLPGAFS